MKKRVFIVTNREDRRADIVGDKLDDAVAACLPAGAAAQPG
jgi:hypothetical protein